MTRELLKHLMIFFVNIVSCLKLLPKDNGKTDIGNDNKQIINHKRIKYIKSRKKEEQTFTFIYISYEEVLKKG